jgi:formylglycine-generating enzyme required for sulfatase activity
LTVIPAVIGQAGVEWLEIPQGTFTMGCTQGDAECGSDELPAREVRISRGFLMAATETTIAQYRVCVEAAVCEPPKDRSSFDSRTMASHPVGNVTWRQAKTFCEWAGGRLPTEAEWEFAARGGRQGWRYPWGNQRSPGDASFGGTGGRDVFKESSPAKSFDPNGFGLYDMSGNVWEWCADWYDPGYYVRTDLVDPKGPAKGRYRVLRGGGWRNLDPAVLRVSARFKFLPGYWFDYFGFRCVRDP